MILDKIIAQKLVKRIMKSLDHNINVMDEYGVIIASGDESRLGKVHLGALEVIKEKKNMPYFKYINNDNESSKPGINIPLMLNDNIIGVLGITGKPKELEKITTIVKLTAEILLEQVLHIDQKISKEASQNTYLSRLISKNNIEYIPSILIWAETNKYSFEGIHRMVCLINFEQNDDISQYKISSYIMSKIESLTSFNKEDIISYFGNRQFILLKSIGKEHIELQKKYIQDLFISLRNSIDSQFNLRFNVMCGASTSNMREIPYSYDQSKFLYNWPKSYNKDNIFFIDEYMLEFFISNSNQRDLEMISRNFTDQIKNKKDLIETIVVMSRSNMSLKKASEVLLVHRNTVIYRMNKIKEILKLDPLNNQIDRVKFHIISIILSNNED